MSTWLSDTFPRSLSIYLPLGGGMHFLKCSNEHVSNRLSGSASSSSALLHCPYGINSASKRTGRNAAVPVIIMVRLCTFAFDIAPTYNKMPVCAPTD